MTIPETGTEMQKSTGIFIIGFAAGLCLCALSAKADPAPHSPLFDAIDLRYQGVVEGTSFPYYSQAERIQTITDLIQSIQSDYSLMLYKQHTLGVDIVQIGNDAVKTEQSIADVTVDKDQALGNMQFLDRVRKITANFQDSHFQLDAVDGPAAVSLGFVVTNISGKYLVTSVRPSYLANKTLNFDFTAQVAIGDELVSIDGQDPLTAAQTLKPYLPGSSDLYRTDSAIFNLTSRDFALPTQATSAVVLRRNGSAISLNLPWGAEGVSRSDQALYLKNVGIQPAMQNLGLTAPSPFGEAWRTKIGALKNEVDFTDVSDPTTPVVTIGTLDSPSGPVGYLQIQSYMITALSPYQAPQPAPSSPPAQVLGALAKLTSPARYPDLSSVKTIMDGAPKPQGLFPIAPGASTLFPDFIDAVISTFKSNSMPLILDMRYNPGGEIGEALALVGDLAPTNGSINALSQMFRITNLAWESIDSAVAGGLVDPLNLDPTAVVVSSVFTDARSKGSDYSEILPASPLTTSKVVNGYDQKIVVLTSPFCVSACDATALLLKSSGRATLMGEASNGTGAGFFSTFEVPDFTDTNHIIVAHLPNSLFGRPLQSGEDAKTVSVESVEAENHPTQPDVVVTQTLNDVQNGNSDLITAAIAKVTSK
jgi:hypothetical protein